MAELRCRTCGGQLVFPENATICQCEYCNTYQTLPKSSDEQKLALIDRANQLRQASKYDEAIGLYGDLSKEDPYDSDIYWSMVLCRYGVEYVKDPASGQHVPTVNRMQYTSIFDDVDYKSALQYADISQKMLYESQARAINQIQKQSLSIIENEEPFDVFICFKETDNGNRTVDSTLANDIYYELTDCGYKVFFSPITLEDKLGSEYEPYIFAALNSAKVMVAIGTKPEYFQAPWVKNEWSRFLALIKGGAKKKLIPAYRDMNPYDLPEEFSHLQAQDMSKIGFVQQLIRGINTLIPKDAAATAPAAAPVTAGTDDLLRRAKVFLEDENWNNTIQCSQEAIYIDPACGDAHLYLLLATNNVSKVSGLASYSGDTLANDKLFCNAMKYCDADTKKALEVVSEQHVCGRLVRQHLDSHPFTNLSRFARAYLQAGGQGVCDNNRLAKDVYRDISSKLTTLQSYANQYPDFNKALTAQVLIPIYQHAASSSGWGSSDPNCLLNAVSLLHLIAPYHPKSKEFLDKYSDEIRLHKQLSRLNTAAIRSEMENAQTEHAGDQDYLDRMMPVYRSWLTINDQRDRRIAEARAAKERQEQAARKAEEREQAMARQKAEEEKKKLAKAKRKKRNSTIFWIIVFVVLFTAVFFVTEVLPPLVNDGFIDGEKTMDGLIYVDKGDYIVIEGVDNQKNIPAKLVIPAKANNKPVYEIHGGISSTKLETLVISENVKIIGMSAFSGCQNLKSIELPSTITSIGYGAFEYCTGVETFKFNGTMEQWNAIEFDGFVFHESSINEVICTDGTVVLTDPIE